MKRKGMEEGPFFNGCSCFYSQPEGAIVTGKSHLTGNQQRCVKLSDLRSGPSARCIAKLRPTYFQLPLIPCYNNYMKPRLYLRVGNRVTHLHYQDWGRGVVTEEKHSSLAGGFCLVKVVFDDGEERSFINDLDNQGCCYYSGLRIEY